MRFTLLACVLLLVLFASIEAKKKKEKTPTLKIIKAGKRKAKIKFTKIPGAYNYQLYYSRAYMADVAATAYTEVFHPSSMDKKKVMKRTLKGLPQGEELSIYLSITDKNGTYVDTVFSNEHLKMKGKSDGSYQNIGLPYPGIDVDDALGEAPHPKVPRPPALGGMAPPSPDVDAE